MSIGGAPAPLLYVSDSQIDAVVPMGSPKGLTDIAVTSATTVFRSMEVGAAPTIFLNPSGDAAALNQDGTVNSASNGAAPGSIVSIWANGTGSNYSPLQDGQMATSADNVCGCLVVFFPSQILMIPPYAGAAPGLVAGVTQINALLPAQSGSSLVTIMLSVNGATTSANVWVRANVFLPFAVAEYQGSAGTRSLSRAKFTGPR